MTNSRRSSISSRSQPVTLLDEIDEWERGTLILVKQTAERARQRANELMISEKNSNDFRRRNSVDSSVDQLNFRLKNLQTALNSAPIRLNILQLIGQQFFVFLSKHHRHQIMIFYQRNNSFLVEHFYTRRSNSIE